MSIEPVLRCILTGPIDVNCYIIGCPETREAVIIDPGGNGDRIKEELVELKLKPVAIIDTHGHFDHIGGNAWLMVHFDSLQLYIHSDGLNYLRNTHENAE